MNFDQNLAVIILSLIGVHSLGYLEASFYGAPFYYLLAKCDII